MKTLISFDGTGNQPKDAEQDVDENSVIEDDNITNVLKLHLLAGGDLTADDPVRKSGRIEGQLPLYFSGVGTRGSRLRRIFRKAFALFGPKTIIAEALEDLEKVYEKGDRLYVFGFSRGAAIARVFASRIAENGLRTSSGEVDPQPVIEMLGVWDTVASFNKPEIERDDPLPSGEELEEKGAISPIIRKACHAVSLDERRLAFRPTLMNVEDRIQEVWFSGVHSDVGGGFRADGLADVTLRFMLDRARENGLDFLGVEQFSEDFVGEDQDGEEVHIGRDDVEIAPDSLARIHQQERSARKAKITLHPRQILALRDDQPSSTDLPVIHHTVVERIAADPEYRPESLQNARHRVLEKDGSLREADGLDDHLTSA